MVESVHDVTFSTPSKHREKVQFYRKEEKEQDTEKKGGDRDSREGNNPSRIILGHITPQCGINPHWYAQDYTNDHGAEGEFQGIG